MILFVNFAPISFMGGAEKWMNVTARKVDEYEDAYTVSTAPQIANIYGRLVLKRKFERRAKEQDLHQNISLTYVTFIPLTQEWKKARNLFQKARVIYCKYEILESMIILYFGGMSGFHKTIAGIHSPFLYSVPESFLDRLHNTIYGSSVNTWVLSKTKKIHVINKKDFHIMTKNLQLKNVVYVPNGIDTPEKKIKVNKTKGDMLSILFIGELSKRKGVDILIELIEQSPKQYVFTIAGDGPMKEDVQKLAGSKKNCIYKGFISEKEREILYSENDVLILPSRAESMSLAVLEALSHGLTIVDSKEVFLNLDKNSEYSSGNNPEGYLQVLQKLHGAKKEEKLNREAIQIYFKKNFSSEVVYPQLFKELFELTI